MESVYDLFCRGSALLEAGDHHAAIVALARAREREPEEASIREALGRACFHAQHCEQAADE
ncbi:MAG: tetratricopeptide repeat protein, partial [Solirubrobacteraceae bacterium]